MSGRTATGRLMGWEQLGTRSWGLGVAADILSLEERLAKLESHAARCPMGIDCPGPADEVNGGGDMTDHWTELNLRMERAFQNQRLASEARSLRDHFAAAALTGLLSQCAAEDREAAETAAAAMRYADAMLRERGNHSETPNSSPNLDAAPAAIANAESVAPQPTARGESDRNDKAAPRPSAGTGDTPDSPKPIKGGVSDRSKPINGPDPDSRVWETPVHTPAPHATPGEGSVPREGTQEPVAWAVTMGDGSVYEAFAAHQHGEAVALAKRCMFGTAGPLPLAPLYRHPPVTEPLPKTKRAEVSAEPAAWYVRNRAAGPPMLFWDEERAKKAAFACGVGARPLYLCQDFSQKNLTLTDAEREAVERAVDSIASTMPYQSRQGLADWETLRGLLERLGGGR